MTYFGCTRNGDPRNPIIKKWSKKLSEEAGGNKGGVEEGVSSENVLERVDDERDDVDDGGLLFNIELARPA